jgi:aminopeptidase N
LPQLARPTHYDLELWVDPHAPTFRGRVDIDLDVLQPMRVLWLNATGLAVEEARLVGPAGALGAARVVPGGEDFVGFLFDREVQPGEARLSIAYHGTVDPQRSRGIYAAREGDGEPYVYTFFEPIDARRAFPCFDEPAYKVPWKLSFHVPRGDVALANTPVVAERAEGDGKFVETAESKPLPSYLVAFVVGPFDVVDAGTAGHFATPLRFVVPKGRGGETAYAASVTPRIVGLLEDYFGMPYPYGKLDVAVVPYYWGTMEHPGLVALGQPLTLIRSADRGVRREQHYANIAAHELAHYWFGDYVTTAWWDDTWLNEALGTWMDEKVTEELVPAWHFDLERLDRAAQGMRGDALTSAKRIRQPIGSRGDIESSFDADITYYKGQAVLSMFEAWMTPERFRRAVRAYVKQHAWGSARAEDFYAALDAERPGAGDAMRTFVDQPGIPSVTLETVCGANERAIVVHQRRYRPVGETPPDERWKVPVCVRYPQQRGGSPTTTCALLSDETATVPLDARDCPAWLVGNAAGAGYYHVAYTPAQLRAALAPSARVTTADRVALLHDAAALVATGELPLADALALVPETAASRERQVVSAGLDLVHLVPAAALDDRETMERARFVRAAYGARAKQLGFIHRPDDGVDGELVRPELLSLVMLSGEDASLRRRAHELARAWLADEHAVPPEVVDGVLAAAAKSNDEELFDALFEKARASNDHRKVAQLLRALGAFTAPALVRRADAIVAGTAFDVRDAFPILSAQFDDRAAREQAWTSLKASFDEVTARMRSDEVLFRFFELTRSFCDEDHRRDVERFLGPRAARFDGGSRALTRALESIEQCTAQFGRNKASLDAFLRR